MAEEKDIDLYDDLEDLEVMVQVATKVSIHDMSMIGSNGFKPTKEPVASTLGVGVEPGTDA